MESGFSGASKEKHLKRIAHHLKKPPKFFEDRPELKKEYRYLWNYYIQVRGENVSFQEIQNWANLMGIDITPWEVSIIRDIDLVYWNVRRRSRAEGKS